MSDILTFSTNKSVSDLEFTIASSDRVVNKSGVTVTFSFTIQTTIPPGGAITLNYPTGFFASGVTPITCACFSPRSILISGATGLNSIVLVVGNNMLPASSVTVTLNGMTMGANPNAGGPITVTTSADMSPSASAPSGKIE